MTRDEFDNLKIGDIVYIASGFKREVLGYYNLPLSTGELGLWTRAYEIKNIKFNEIFTDFKLEINELHKTRLPDYIGYDCFNLYPIKVFKPCELNDSEFLVDVQTKTD